MSYIKLHENGKAKFILLIPKDKFEELIQMEDPDMFSDYYIVSNKEAEFHEHILLGFQREKSTEFICVGGGMMEISDTEVFAYGTSKDYKTANRRIVKKVLSENVVTKTIKIDMGVDH